MFDGPYPVYVLEAFRIIREGTPREFQRELQEAPVLLKNWGPTMLTYAVENRPEFLPVLGAAGIDAPLSNG